MAIMNTKTRTISTADGRQLRIREVGHPDGIPILAHHGTPSSSHLSLPLVKDAEACGIRLIKYDRPGYGTSTPQAERTVASAAGDVTAIAKELKLSRLSVWGISGGGPYALACAALLPGLVVAAAALASPAPYHADGLDWFAGMGEGNVAEFRAALQGRKAVAEFVEAVAPGMLGATPADVIQAFGSLLTPVDAAVVTEDFANDVVSNFHEGIGAQRDGWIDDDLALAKAWGFELDRIQVPVLLMHGAQDKMLPFSHGKWLANKIPGVDVHFLPEDGHLTLAAHRIPEVHAWLLSRM